MLPLSIFLIIWLVLLGVYFFVALVSIIQMARYAIASTTAYTVTAIYIAIAGLVIIVTAIYLLTVNWSQVLDLTNVFRSPYL